MATFGTQTNSPEYFIRGSLAPVIELTGGGVPQGTQAVLTLAGTTLTINGTVQVSGANRSFVPNAGMRVPSDATVGNALVAVLTAVGHTSLNIVADVSPAPATADCATPNASFTPIAIIPNTIIQYQDGRRERVLLIDTDTVSTLGTTGGTLGFYGTAGVVQPAAYTQTYAVASRTQTNLTAVALVNSTTGTANNTVVDVTAAFSQTILNSNFADLIAQINALIVDVTNNKQVINSVIDDLQANGLLQ